MVDVIISVVAKVAELLAVPIGKHIIYPFKYKSNMEELTKQVEKLTDQREMVQHSVDEAKRQGDEIEKKVEKWLTSVDEFTKGVVKPIIDDQVKAGKLCSIGFCPNLMARYSLSRKAAKTTEKGVHLLGEGTFGEVSYRPPLQRTTSYNRDYEYFDSRKQVFNDLMETLRKADVNLIGVYGMGGVGKTTLVKRVVWEAIKDKLFDDVVMAEVTETPDIKNIQGQIADKLGLTFKEESLSGRADRLRDRLKKEKRLLLVLDNIWAKLDLEAVGLPLGEEEEKRSSLQADQKGRNDEQRQGKILFTSRNLDVLRNDMNTQKNFLVEILSVEEAEKLFWKIVGHSEEKPDLNHIAVEIVERCAGLPVAIATIATALKNKSLHVWKNALDQLRTSNPRNIEGMHANVYSAIELSYNYLEGEEAKSLFLLFGLMAASGIRPNIKAANGPIRDHELFKYAIGWGLFQDVHTMEQGRNKLHTLIDSLKASCLLLEEDYGNSSQIKMHDIIHAVAVSIASTKKLMFNIRTATRLKEMLEEELPRDATAVSLPYVQEDICELPERLELPKLKLLYLCKKDLNPLQISDTFFEGVKELKVLNLTKFHLSSLPSSLQLLTNLQTLCLFDCMLGDIASIGYLTKLEVLSLADSDIEQLPKEIRQLTRLRYLDMSQCTKLQTITPGVISSLTRLEELYMGDFDQWDVNERMTNASLTELKQLAHLTALTIHIRDVHVIPHDLFSTKLDWYIIFIGDVWGWFGNFSKTTKTLRLKCSNKIYLDSGIRTLLNRTEDLHLDELKGVKNILYELDEEGFPRLKHLHVQNGLEVQDIINSDRLGPSTFFPKLESLFLRNLINLEKICNGQLAIESFSKLRIVKVEKCDRLKHLFSFSMAKNLLKLEEIAVIDCKKLEEIVFNNSDKQFHQNGRVNRTEFPQLRTLRLQCLPQLTSFGLNAFTPEIGSQEILAEDELGGFTPSFSQNVLLPRLEKLKLSSINIECLWLDQLPAMSSCCKTLTSLTLEDCSGNLKFLFSYSMIKSLVQLQKLKVRNCKSIEGVINSEELRGEGKVIELTSLAELWLENCPKMHAFVSNSPRADMPAAKEEQKNSENNLQYSHIQPFFDEKNMLGRLQKLAVLEVSDCKSVEVIFEELNTTEEDVETVPRFVFPQLTSLLLSDLPSLRSFYPGLYISEWPKLNKLRMWGCNKVEILTSEYSSFEKSHGGSQLENSIQEQLFIVDKVAFPKIEHLALEWNWIVKEILHRNFSKYSCNLKVVELIRASKQSGICPCCFLCTLTNLERLDVYDGFFEEIFTCGGLDCKKKHAETPSKLSQLRLVGLADSLHQWEEDSLLCKVFRNLTSLEVSYCHNLKNLVRSFVSFQNLKKLEVSHCDGLVNLMEVSVAKSLVQLTRLKISECKMIEEIIMHGVDEVGNRMIFDQLEYLELHSLPKLTSFCSWNCNIEFPSLQQIVVRQCPTMEIFSQGVLSTPKLQRLQTAEVDDEGSWEGSLNTTIQKLFKDMIGFRDFEHLTTSEFPHLKEVWHGQFPVQVFCNLKSLVMDDCANISSAISGNLLQHLNSLEKLHVRNGDSLEEVFDLEELNADGDLKVLSQLSEFFLADLPRLEHIWKKKNSEVLGFRNLKLMKVYNCSSLRYIFTPSVVLGLMQLQELEIKNCAIMEEIITMEGENDAVAIEKITFLQLNCLVVDSLPNLTSFYSGSNTLECPSLTTININDCPKMVTFVFTHLKDSCTGIAPLFGEKVGFPSLEKMVISSMDNLESIWHNQFLGDSFYKLKSVEVNDCQELKTIFPSCICERLLWLESVTVKSCGSVTEIFDLRGINLKEKHSIQTTPQLRELYVDHMSNLKHIWNEDPKGMLSFEKLEKVTVFLCPNLENLFPASVAKSLLNLDSLEVSDCGVKEIIAKEGVKEAAADRFLFPQLSSLQLHNLPRLRTFYPGHTVEGPCLKRLGLHHCDKVTLFISEFIGFYETIEEGQLDISIREQPPFFLVQEIEGTNQRFPNLDELQLSGKAMAMAMRWPSQVPGHDFRSLKSLELNDHESTVVPIDFIKRFGNLEKLSLNSSSYNKEIFSYGKDKEHPEIKHLVLSGLFDLKQIWKQGSKVDPNFQNLRILEVRSCFNLINLMPSSASFRNLMILEVWGCDSLKNLLTSSTAKSLVLLEKLEVFDCKMLTEVVANEGAVREEIVFGKLKSLSLVYLQSLASFCSAKHTLDFPILESLVVNECPKMKIFSKGVTSMSTPKLHKLELNWKAIEHSWEVGVNTIIQQNMERGLLGR